MQGDIFLLTLTLKANVRVRNIDLIQYARQSFATVYVSRIRKKVFIIVFNFELLALFLFELKKAKHLCLIPLH